MQDFLHQKADAGRLYQTADAGVSIRQRMQESIRQWMQETLYQTVDAGDSLSDSGCRRLSIRYWMHETLLQTAEAGDLLSDS